MADKKAPGRPKRATATKRSEATKESKVESSEIKDQNDAKIDQSIDEAEETNKQDLAGKEKVVEIPKGEKTEIDKLKEENAKIKAELAKREEPAEKVVEVTTGPSKEVKTRPSQMNKLTHTVYVAKKTGDTWGATQTREMSGQAYDAIAKDLSLRVTLPKDSRLVEPEIKGCKDC